MSGYLSHLAESTSVPTPAIRPRLRGLFEPTTRTTAFGDEPSTPHAEERMLEEGEQETDHSLRAVRHKHRAGPPEHMPSAPSDDSPCEQRVSRMVPQLRVVEEARRRTDKLQPPAEADRVSAAVESKSEQEPRHRGVREELNSSNDRPPFRHGQALSQAPVSPPMPVQPTMQQRTTQHEVRPSGIAPVTTVQRAIVRNQNLGERHDRFREEPSISRNRTPDAEPTVQVTIGRVEVRAVAGHSEPRRSERTPSPVLSLDDYLRQRARRGRE